MSASHPVVFRFAGVEHHLTIEEACDVLARLGLAVNAQRVKCPTCRCRILPGVECRCCGEPALESDETAF